MLPIRPLLSVMLLTTCGASFAATLAISTCEELQNIESTGLYVLSNDIDCKGVRFHPIGNFLGSLDGQGYSISNLTIEKDPETNAGLFTTLGDAQSVYPAVIQNIVFNSAKVIGADNTNRGLLAGTSYHANISNITVDTLHIATSGDKQRTSSTGGLLGVASNTALTQVHLSDLNIHKNRYAGGLIGTAQSGVSIEKASIKSLESSDFGCDEGKTCSFGGLIGLVTGEANSIPVSIDQAFATGVILTKKNAGGLVGYIEPTANLNISNSYSNVNVDRKCTLYDGCLSKYAGNIIGRAPAGSGVIQLQYVYSAGGIELHGNEGGKAVIGGDGGPAKRASGIESYYIVEDTIAKYAGDNFSVKLHRSDMKDPEIFAAWDENIWEITTSAYPRLKMQ